MNFEPVKVGLLIKTLATMPADAAVYVEVSLPESGTYRAPLLSVGTLRDVNEVHLGGPCRPDAPAAHDHPRRTA
jgi:hypothetical protein